MIVLKNSVQDGLLGLHVEHMDLVGSNATRTVSPLRALEVGATRAVILLPLYSRYR